jgi:hypothetical protein
MAPACLYLSAKVEEQPQPISNVLEVFHYMTCARMRKPHVSLSELSDSLVGEMRADLTKMESLLLTQLGFIIHTELPYKFLCAYLDFLGLSSKRELAQRAWNYANDVFRSDACIRYDAPTLACACIHLAAADLSIPLPCDPPWWLVFSVSDVGIACVTMVLQQLLDAPKAINVLEPPPPSPPPIIASDLPGNSEIPSSELSHAPISLKNSAADGGSSTMPDRRVDVCDSEHGGRRNGRGNSSERRSRNDKDVSRGGNYHDDTDDGRENRRWRHHRDEQHSGSGQRAVHSHERRCDDRDLRRDSDRCETWHADRSYHRERDRSREKHRDADSERSDSHSGGRHDSGRDRGQAQRERWREERAHSRDPPVSGRDMEVLHPASRDVVNECKSGMGDNVSKTGRRAGRWDES